MKVSKNLDLQDLDGEIWKDILDYEGDYQVSNIGRVKSFKKWRGTSERVLKPYKIGDYFRVDLCDKNGESKTKLIHRLVFETHNSYRLKDGEDIHHINEDKEDNIFDNLIMMSESEHSSFHSTGKQHSEKTRNKMSENHLNTKGENNPNHILIEQQVIQIKLLLKEGILTQQEIADMFGVSRLTISDIKHGRRWNHITMEIL